MMLFPFRISEYLLKSKFKNDICCFRKSSTRSSTNVFNMNALLPIVMHINKFKYSGKFVIELGNGS